MASFIASTATGDAPTGSIEYETIFAVGFAAVRLHAGPEHDLDPARPQVPAGVRMTGAHIAACARSPAIARRQGRGASRAVLRADVRRDRDRRHLAAALLIRDIASRRQPSCPDFVTSRRKIIPETLGHPVGAARDALPDGAVRGVRRAGRRRDRHLPRGVRGPPRWWNRLIEVNIQNLAAVPSVVYGILGLAFIVRGPLGMGPVLLAGAITLPAGAAGRDHRRARGDPRGAAVDPRGLAGAGRDEVADDLEAGAARLDRRHRHRRDPRAVARDRRDRAADRHRRGGLPALQPGRADSRFTALPIQIFAFSKDHDPRSSLWPPRPSSS